MNRNRIFIVIILMSIILACRQKTDVTIVGRWELDKKGVILHFLSDETFIFEKTFPGKKEKLLGTYKFVDGKYIKTILTTKMDIYDKFREEQEIFEINSLTNDKMILKTPEDTLLTFYRIE